MSKNILWSVAIMNIISVICFTVLAVVFHKWWIALFAILFMSSATTKIGTSRVCDGCGKHSPLANSYNEALEKAKDAGWIHITDGNKDYCPECKAKYKS